MLLLASAEPRVMKRWAGALEGRGPLAQVDNGTRLRLFVTQRRPDLVVLHLALPGLAALSGVRAFMRDFPDTRLLVLSDVPHEQEGIEVLGCGAAGYANTYMMPAKLCSAVDVIAAGQAWVGRALLERLLGNNRPRPEAATSLLELLSKREKQVALLVAEGASNQVVAERLQVKERTVKSHLTSIFKKTGIRDRTQLAVRLSRQNEASLVDEVI